MAVTSKDVLDSANRFLAAKTGHESDLRACVSRAYYAGYHCAKEFHDSLDKPGNPLPGVGSHKSFVNQLSHPNINKNDSNHDKSIAIGTLLNRMLFNRHQSDYELKQTVDERNVTNIYAQAEVIFETVVE